MKVTHIATFLKSLGGLQSVVQHHLERDSNHGIDSRFVILFEKNDINERVLNLGLTWRTSIRGARERLRQLFNPNASHVVIYHDLWGLPFLADLDGAHRRLGMIHAPEPGVMECLRRNHPLLDGVLCVARSTVEIARHCVPEMPGNRIGALSVPIRPPDIRTTWDRPMAGRPIVLGYSGRLIRANKRVDRLPQLYRQLRGAGIDVRLELLGDGPERRSLTREFLGDGNVVFHGRQTGGQYWRTMAGWDAIVYVSDLEGFGISLIEAMHLGVLPIYPKVGGGASYVGQVDGSLLHAPGDIAAVIEAVRYLQSLPDAQLAAMRRRCHELAAPHASDDYHRAFTKFISSIQSAPRSSTQPIPERRAYVGDLLPFALLRRFHPEGLLLGSAY